jgi:type IV pilus assembly protein PilM
VRFTRSISIGGDDLTKAVEQNLGFDFSQAEEYKKTYGLDSKQAEGKVAAAIRPIFDQILNEAKRAKVFYTTHNPNVIINRMIIAGGSALMPGLLFYVANNLDIEVELANPWRNVSLAKGIESQKDQIFENGPTYVTAVGLALKVLVSE